MTSERERHLQDQIEELRRQLEHVRNLVVPAPRRSGSGLMIVGLALLAMVAGLFLVQGPTSAFQREGGRERPDDKPPVKPKIEFKPGTGAQEIVCQSLKIVDPSGVTRMALGYDDRGGTIKLHGKDGVSRISLHVDEEGGVVAVCGHDGKNRAMVWVSQGGKFGLLSALNERGTGIAHVTGASEGGMVQVMSNAGKLRGAMAVEKNKENGLINLFAKEDKRFVFIGSDPSESGGELSIFGKAGNTKAILGSVPDGGGLQLYSNDANKGGCYLGVASGRKSGVLNLFGNSNEKVVFLGEMDTDGTQTGSMFLYGADKKVRVSMDGDKQGGVVRIHSPDGTARGFLWMDQFNRGAMLQLNATDGKARVAAGVGQNGQGFVQGQDAAGAITGTLTGSR